MGNRSSHTRKVIIASNLTGTLEDIFKLVLMPEEKDILERIRTHLRTYPESLESTRNCEFYINGQKHYEKERTPLKLAVKYARYSSIDIIKLLIESDASLSNLLYLACKYSGTTSTTEVAEVLIESGANIHGDDGRWSSPIIIVCRHLNDTSTIDTFVLLINQPSIINTYYDSYAITNTINKRAITFETIIALELVRRKIDEQLQRERARLNLSQ